MNKLNVSKFIGDTRLAISKHSPEILMGLGIAGMITTTILAVRETPKALRLLEEAEHKKGDILTATEKVKTCWKCYIPAVVTGITSTACLLGSHSVQARRTAAFATAYKLSETALTEYKEKVVEKLGEKKEKIIREEIAGDKVKKIPISENPIIFTGTGSSLCLDPLSKRAFISDINKIKKAQNDLNERMLKDTFGYVSLNDLYIELGLDTTDIGDNIGWNIMKNKIDIDFGHGIIQDQNSQYYGQPCIVLDYQVAPQWDYDRF